MTLWYAVFRKVQSTEYRLFSSKVNVRILDLYEELRDGNNLLLLLELLCKTNLVSVIALVIKHLNFFLFLEFVLLSAFLRNQE